MGLQTACVHWMKLRTNLEKTLMSIFVILLFTCILLILVGFVNKGNPNEETEAPFCQSVECYQTTGEVLRMRDISVDPCEDFYDYACGKFVKMNSVPLDHYEASMEQLTSDSIRLHLKRWLELPSGKSNITAYEKARTLYSTCMDYGSQESDNKSILLSLIKEQVNGGWPSLDATWDSENVSLEKFLSSLISLDVSVAFGLDIVPDSSNPNKYIAKISPGSPFLLQHKQDELRGDPVLRSYLVSALTLLGISESTVKNNVEDMLEVDHYFLKIKERADDECGYQDEISDDMGTRRIAFSELDPLMKTKVSWTSLLEDVFRVIGKSRVSAVDVYCRHYIREYIEHLFEELTERQAYNYLATRFFLTFISHLGPSFHEVHRNYIARHSSSKLLRPFQARWKECVFLVEKYMLPVMASAYAQDLPEAVQKEGERISNSIKSRFQQLLPSLSWIEEHERKRIKQKVSKVDFEIALIKYSQHDSQLDNLFSGLHLSEDHLIRNVMRLQKFVVTSRLQKLVLPEQPGVMWQDMTLTSPERYQHHEGLLSIHFDKVVSPFLRLGQSGFLNYGSFGFFLSRELVHYAFISEKINEKLGFCLSNQYSHYNIEKIDKKVNGVETLEENFVDNLAHLIAYKAYESYRGNSWDEQLPGLPLSDYQNFFLSFAQAFCEVRDIDGYRVYVNSTFAPSKVRVNAVLKSFHTFAEAYSCAADSSMNPSRKCDF